MTRINRRLILFPLAFLALASACSSGSKNNNGGNSNTAASGSAVSTGQKSGSGGAALSDCAYRDKLSEAFLPILGSAFDLATISTPGPSGSGGASVAELNKLLDTLVSGLNQSAAAMQKVTPPSDFKALHASFISAVKSSAAQAADLKKSVAGGDTSKVEAFFSDPAGFGAEFDKLQTQYPALSARLDACPSATP